jgi:hypothetical protein
MYNQIRKKKKKSYNVKYAERAVTQACSHPAAGGINLNYLSGKSFLTHESKFLSMFDQRK